jgi:hypothetical protein
MTRRGLFQAVLAAAVGNAIPVGPVLLTPAVVPVPEQLSYRDPWAHTHTVSNTLGHSHSHCCGQAHTHTLGHTHGGHQ